jgi:hypothetical protein
MMRGGGVGGEAIFRVGNKGGLNVIRLGVEWGDGRVALMWRWNDDAERDGAEGGAEMAGEMRVVVEVGSARETQKSWSSFGRLD